MDFPQIKWADYRCRAEFIRPIAIDTIGDKDVTMSYEALRRGRYSLHQLMHWSNEFDPTALLTGETVFFANIDLPAQTGEEPF